MAWEVPNRPSSIDSEVTNTHVNILLLPRKKCWAPGIWVLITAQFKSS